MSIELVITIIGVLLSIIGALLGIILRSVSHRISRLESKMNVILMVIVTLLSKDDINKDMIQALTEAMKE